LKLDQQHLLVAIMLFICCTRNLKFKHRVCLLPYCFSFVVLGILVAQEMENRWKYQMAFWLAAITQNLAHI
jgi:hypothetical protein